MLDNNHITIPKKINTKDDLDYEFLRGEGIKYIEQLGSKLWTDYNSHDPGITIMEVLSYAITDLGMRLSLNMEDILAADEKSKALHNQFIKATEILPTAPLTHLDYRKLLIDVGREIGATRPVKNCWLIPYRETIHADCITGELAFNRNTLGKKTSSFNVKGLYTLLVDVDEEIGDCELDNVYSAIITRFQKNRNLCEDIVAIKEVETQNVAVCARIEVERDVDEEKVHAHVLHKIEQYFAPEVNFYGIPQLLDKGYTTEEIFEGPVLDNGFIDDEELKKSQLRSQLLLSDLVKEIMSIEGVKDIQQISMNDCGASRASKDAWRLCLEEGKKPVLCDLSSFSYSKGTLPLNINQTKVEKYLNEIKEEERLRVENAQQNKELTFPEGNAYDIDDYSSILNEFPDTYGIGSYGIISEATPEREALAKQLKGYLIFFDKILASYFKHLGKVKEILSVTGNVKKTYFTQALKDINGFDELVSKAYNQNNDEALTDLLFEELDNSVQRRNQVLDHLLGRFAEKFSDYVFIMKALYGKSVDEIVLSNKEAFLADYKVIGYTRGLGYNYKAPNNELWNTNNVSGVQKRIARLLGIQDSSRRNVSESVVNILKVNGNGDIKYTWELEDKNGERLLYSNEQFQIEYVTSSTLYTAIFNFIQIDAEELENIFEQPITNDQLLGYIKIKKNGTEYSFEIIDNLEETNVIAISAKTFGNIEELKEGVLATLDYLKYEFSEEGIFLVENILLKPSLNGIKINKNSGIGCMAIESTFIVGGGNGGRTYPLIGEEAFMHGCDGENCEEAVFDPYSYRVTIVLPGYSYRFSDPDFRRYAEAVIRQELPAHVMAKICWVGDRQSETENAKNNLDNFETSYKRFIENKAFGTSEKLTESTIELITSMDNLYNIYRPGRLLDCSAEGRETLDGKIILGQSNL